jgi:C4-type Zn-finger protein
MGLKEASEEIAKFLEEKKKQKKQQFLRSISCPDCGAELRLESKSDLPFDLHIVFVKHSC